VTVPEPEEPTCEEQLEDALYQLNDLRQQVIDVRKDRYTVHETLIPGNVRYEAILHDIIQNAERWDLLVTDDQQFMFVEASWVEITDEVAYTLNEIRPFQDVQATPQGQKRIWPPKKTDDA
jgi:hypothetical protein